MAYSIKRSYGLRSFVCDVFCDYATVYHLPFFVFLTTYIVCALSILYPTSSCLLPNLLKTANATFGKKLAHSALGQAISVGCLEGQIAAIMMEAFSQGPR